MFDEKKVKKIKEMYPKGTRIKLNYMNDDYAVPSGTLGTVDFVDDAGQIQMTWDNGRTLALEYGVDSFEVINKGIKQLTTSEVLELRNRNYEFLILQGCGGDLNEWINGFTDMLKEQGIVSKTFSFDEVYSFEVNNLTNMAFALNSKDISMEKLALFRLMIRNDFGAMWLSDYIDNGYIKDINI